MRIGGFVPFTLSDFPGRVSAIIFTQGCNFRCPYCHNPSLVLPEKYSEPINTETILDFLEARKGKLDGVVISGGEPTIQPDLIEFLERIKRLDYQVKLDTNGSNPEIVKELIDRGLIDYCAMDVKAPWGKYSLLTGKENICISDIKRTLEILLGSDIEVEFRTTLVKPLLSDEDIEEISSYFPRGFSLTLQRFIPENALKKELFTCEQISDGRGTLKH